MGLVNVQKHVEIEFLKSKSYEEINDMFRELGETLRKSQLKVKEQEQNIDLYVEWLCGQTKISRWAIRGKIEHNNYELLMEMFKKEAPKPTILDTQKDQND